MSDDERFLSRWSRRKRDAATPTHDLPAAEQAATGGASRAGSAPPEPAQPPADVASLPPIESIGATSDIRSFLARGVPAETVRAALRRAWSADPSIRDFVGLSENAWDFTAPGGVPGFGSLDAEDVRRLLAQLSGEPEAAEGQRLVSEQPSEDQTQARTPRPAQDVDPSTQKLPEQREHSADDGSRTRSANDIGIAAQQEIAAPEYRAPSDRRRHGGALPE